jgi:hypothetical protein
MLPSACPIAPLPTFAGARSEASLWLRCGNLANRIESRLSGIKQSFLFLPKLTRTSAHIAALLARVISFEWRFGATPKSPFESLTRLQEMAHELKLPVESSNASGYRVMLADSFAIKSPPCICTLDGTRARGRRREPRQAARKSQRCNYVQATTTTMKSRHWSQSVRRSGGFARALHVCLDWGMRAVGPSHYLFSVFRGGCPDSFRSRTRNALRQFRFDRGRR